MPVYIGHSESVNVELEKPVTREDIINSFKNYGVGDVETHHGASQIVVIDDPDNSQYPMPIDIAGTDPVYVGRIREDKSNPNTFNMWIVADNLRIGAALNAVRIAEIVVRESLFVTHK